MGAPSPARHPLAPLSDQEFRAARDAVLAAYGTHPSALFFRAIEVEEPRKADLVPFLVAENAGTLTSETPRPPRLARVQYDVISAREDGKGSLYRYTQSVVNLGTGEEVSRETAPDGCHAAYLPYVSNSPGDVSV